MSDLVLTLVVLLLYFVVPARNQTTWSTTARQNIDEYDDKQGFGASVDMDDSFLVIGANTEHEVYVYDYSSGSDSWGTTAVATLSSHTGVNGFGNSVGIDGNYIIVGANTAKEAYIFEYGGSSWSTGSGSPTVSITGYSSIYSFGVDVDIQGNYAIVGSYGSASDG